MRKRWKNVTPVKYDFDNKVFRVVAIEGLCGGLGEETVFSFKQTGNAVHADYFGGRIKIGKFVGLIEGDKIRFRYVQINEHNEFYVGQSIGRIECAQDGKIRLIDEWEWDARFGRGRCVLEEV